MTDKNGKKKLRNDPMGVKRPWGRREIVLLAATVILVVATAIASRMGHPGRPAAGVPIGGIPRTAPAALSHGAR